jgi:hypothetical protein
MLVVHLLWTLLGKIQGSVSLQKSLQNVQFLFGSLFAGWDFPSIILLEYFHITEFEDTKTFVPRNRFDSLPKFLLKTP